MELLDFTSFPVLKTDRLLMRQMNAGDADAIFALRSDDIVNQYIDRQEMESKEDALKFIERINKSIDEKKILFWMMDHKENKQAIGTLCLWNIEPLTKRGEIGYELLPSFFGYGLMQEAISKLLEYCFHTLEFNTLEAVTMPENTRSVKLLDRNGFRRNAERERTITDLGGFSIYSLESRSFITRG